LIIKNIIYTFAGITYNRYDLFILQLTNNIIPNKQSICKVTTNFISCQFLPWLEDHKCSL